MASPMRRAQNLAQRALSLPAFLLAVFFMYWSVPLCMLLGQIRTLNFTGSRNDAYGWCAIWDLNADAVSETSTQLSLTPPSDEAVFCAPPF